MHAPLGLSPRQQSYPALTCAPTPPSPCCRSVLVRYRARQSDMMRRQKKRVSDMLALLLLLLLMALHSAGIRCRRKVPGKLDMCSGCGRQAHKAEQQGCPREAGERCV